MFASGPARSPYNYGAKNTTCFKYRQSYEEHTPHRQAKAKKNGIDESNQRRRIVSPGCQSHASIGINRLQDVDDPTSNFFSFLVPYVTNFESLFSNNRNRACGG
jgi:hypothetical protein